MPGLRWTYPGRHQDLGLRRTSRRNRIVFAAVKERKASFYIWNARASIIVLARFWRAFVADGN